MKKILFYLFFLFFPATLIIQAEVIPELGKELGMGLVLEQPQKILEEEKNKVTESYPLHALSLYDRPYKVSVSHNSNYLSFATKQGKLFVYDIKNGLSLVLNKKVSRAPLYALTSHPAQNKIVFGDSDGFIGIFDLIDKNFKKTIYEMISPVSDIKYSSDGKILAVSHLGGYVTLYDAETKKLLLKAKPHDKSIYSICIDKNSSSFITASKDKTVKLFSLDKNKVRDTFKNHTSIVLACDLSYDDEFLATAGSNGLLVIQKKKNNYFGRQPYFTWICGSWISSAKFFKNFLLAASQDGKIRIFDYKKKSLLKIIDVGKPILDIDINSDYFCAASPESFRIYDTKLLLGKNNHGK